MITIPASKLDTSIFMGNAQLQAIHYRGFHPSRCGFPDSITPEQEHIIIAKHRGSMKGQALSPPSSYSTLNFISMEKEFSRAINSIMDIRLSI